MLIFIHLLNSNGVVVVALVSLRWSVFVLIKLSQNVKFYYLLVLSTDGLFNLNIFEIYIDAFLGCYCVVDMLRVHGIIKFLILVFTFLNMSFFLCFVFILDAIFCGTKFFIFQDIVWPVKSTCRVHCCSFHQFYWVSDRCRSEFALW